MEFYLGTHEPSWLESTDQPLFISRRRLEMRKTLPVARGRWALDSGGFTELQMFGGWRTGLTEYVDLVHRFDSEIGGLDFAAPMDWMCEPAVIEGGTFGGQVFVGTKLSVREHQERTVQNYLDLRVAAPDLPFIPVLQGYEIHEYLTCVDLYEQAGVDLSVAPLVGVGSVCRREYSSQIGHLMSTLSALPLHGFGVKIRGLLRYGYLLASADSLGWSARARHIANERRRGELGPLPGCTHQSCANCKRFALTWRARLLNRLDAAHVQSSLFDKAIA